MLIIYSVYIIIIIIIVIMIITIAIIMIELVTVIIAILFIIVIINIITVTPILMATNMQTHHQVLTFFSPFASVSQCGVAGFPKNFPFLLVSGPFLRDLPGFVCLLTVHSILTCVTSCYD